MAKFDVSKFFRHRSSSGRYEYNEGAWFDWTPGDDKACLDGHFTPDELLNIAIELKARIKMLPKDNS